jgi:phosphoserine phosphatase
MRAQEPIGEAEQQYLLAVHDLAGGRAKVPVAFSDIQEHLSCTDAQAAEWCDFWANRRAIEWPARGHIALTHLGLARVKANGGRVECSADHHASVTGSVSVVIPALNEATTIGHLVTLARRSPRVLEVIVVDDGSIDGTPDIASRAGAQVITSTLLGKGASMGDGVEASRGEVLLFLDGDLLEIPEDFIERMVSPVLEGNADFVKARFTRDAGRVTVLTARPLLSAFFPELAGFEQPLGGIVAARRSLLSNIRLENDYGVDVGLLIDAVMRGARAAEVDIGHIHHESQSLEALGQMAKQVARVILDRAWRHERLSINQVREMQEVERRTRADLLPHACNAPHAGGRLALFDMDGVLLDGRFVVELAGRVGAESELSFLLDSKILPDIERTRSVASLFAGVHWDMFEETALALPLMEGAVETVVGLREAGYQVGIVTDSFHAAAEIVRRRVFADFCVAHVMRFRNCIATGEVTLSPLMAARDGCAQHEYCKANVMYNLCQTAGFGPELTLAVGDGDNDICMLRGARTSVAFRPKSAAVQAAATHTCSRSLIDVLDLVLPRAGAVPLKHHGARLSRRDGISRIGPTEKAYAAAKTA